ncbi:MAG: DUF3347 domain-containing protein [Chitinophagaceae bacterium]
MKKIFFALIAIASLAFVACNNNEQEDNQDMDKMSKDSTAPTSSAGDKDVKVVAVTYSDVNPQLATSLKEMVDHYLHIKNALANDNENEAKSGGEAMVAAMNKVDKSLFTAEQKKIYDDNEEDLREHAEHIGKSKLDHQREHFAMMSEDVYALAKAFGSGRTLYHDHCPMYDNNKGAKWLSETVEIKNPYMGSKMPKCGTVEEKIQ